MISFLLGALARRSVRVVVVILATVALSTVDVAPWFRGVVVGVVCFFVWRAVRRHFGIGSVRSIFGRGDSRDY